MKKLGLAIVGIASLGTLAACDGMFLSKVYGSGEIETREYSLDSFSMFSISTFHYESNEKEAFVVNFHKGEEKKVTLSAQANLFEYMDLKTENSKLLFKGKWDKKLMTSTITLDVTGYSLKDIGVGAASCCYIDDDVLMDDAVLKLSGASKYILGDVNVNSLKLIVSGASLISANSIKTTAKTSLDLSGASKFVVKDMECDELDFETSGASNITIENLKIGTGTSKFDFSGASKLTATKIEADVLKFEVSGASEMKISNIKADKIDLESDGASAFKNETGEINEFKADISGAGSIKSLADINNFIIEASGASKATVKVNNSIICELSGASTLEYYGAAQIESMKTSGGSTIKHLTD